MTKNLEVWFRVSIVILFAWLSSAAPIVAQTASPGQKTFTLEGAVRYALEPYPAVRASLEQRNAARAAVALARTNYLPRADLLAGQSSHPQ